jgi:hypothetical protein
VRQGADEEGRRGAFPARDAAARGSAPFAPTAIARGRAAFAEEDFMSGAISGSSSTPPDWELSVGDDVQRGNGGEVSDQASVTLDVNNSRSIRTPLACNVHATYGALFYDPLVGNVIGWGRDRAEAGARLRRALYELRLAAKDLGGNNDVQTSAGLELGLEGDGTELAVERKVAGSTAGTVGVGAEISLRQRFKNALSIGANAVYTTFIGNDATNLSGPYAGVTAGFSF